MLRYILIFCAFTAYFVTCVFNPGPKYPPTKGEVWPKPQRETKTNNFYIFVPSQFEFQITNQNCSILSKAAIRCLSTLTTLVDVQRWHRRDLRRNGNLASPSKEFYSNYMGTLRELQIDLTKPCEDYPYYEMDERYEISISDTSVLRSDSVWGILRGLETFSQLFYLTDKHYEVCINETEITDFPRFPHRGFLLDTGRHYLKMTSILKHLDAMAMNKMNVFHWHIVDDQSFPYQSKKFPELSEEGAYHSSMVYTMNNIKMVINYARDRGIRVMPEFDVPGDDQTIILNKFLYETNIEFAKKNNPFIQNCNPTRAKCMGQLIFFRDFDVGPIEKVVQFDGHSRSWGESHPELLTACYSNSEVFTGLGPINPINEEVYYPLLRELFREVQALFPDKYFHIGGDEVDTSCWTSNPEIKAYMWKHNITNVQKLHAMFVKNTISLLANGTKVVVWQEVFDEKVPLSKDTLIQVWNYYWIDEMVEVLTAGHKVLFSASWYLNILTDKFIDFYTADPRRMVYQETKNATLGKNIVGGEACLWGEMVDDNNVLSRSWPRASAVAEVLWSRGLKEDSVPLEVYHRIEEHTCRMVRRGIPAEPPSGPGFCLTRRLQNDKNDTRGRGTRFLGGGMRGL